MNEQTAVAFMELYRETVEVAEIRDFEGYSWRTIFYDLAETHARRVAQDQQRIAALEAENARLREQLRLMGNRAGYRVMTFIEIDEQVDTRLREQIRHLYLEQHKKIQAIKMLRVQTDCGLREAKAWIEALENAALNDNAAED